MGAGDDAVPDHLRDLLLTGRGETLRSPRTAMAGLEAGCDTGHVSRIRRPARAPQAPARREGCDGQQHLGVLENLVSSLSEKAGRDAKTNLLNFPRFEEALTILSRPSAGSSLRGPG